jgi:hypothetical protein
LDPDAREDVLMSAEAAPVLPGTEVRFTVGPLGLIAGDTPAGKFEDALVNVGDLGEYIGPHTTMLEKGWHLIAVGERTCPCHRSHFEVIG